MLQAYLLIFNKLTNKMMSDLYMLGLAVLYRIFGDIDSGQFEVAEFGSAHASFRRGIRVFRWFSTSRWQIMKSLKSEDHQGVKSQILSLIKRLKYLCLSDVSIFYNSKVVVSDLFTW